MYQVSFFLLQGSDYLQDLYPSLATFSLSRTSIHTLLEHLRIEDMLLNEDSGISEVIKFRTPNVHTSSEHVLDGVDSSLECGRTNSFDSNLECDSNGEWDCTSTAPCSAEKMQPEVKVPATNCEESGGRLESEFEDSGSYFQVEYNCKKAENVLDDVGV
jgi:hypothetical protein